MKLKIKYFTNIEKIHFTDKGDWVDLRCAEDTIMKKGEYRLIPLGIAMELPLAYEAHIVPRSSTYKHFGLIQTNHMGIVDNSYCGNDDQWYFSAIAFRDTTIKKNDRICQFRVVMKQPTFEFEEVKSLENNNRGGFGSTGKS